MAWKWQRNRQIQRAHSESLAEDGCAPMFMQVASCGNITTGAESKSRALGMCYSCLEKEPKRKKLATFKLQLFRHVSTAVQHQYAQFNKRNCDFRVMPPLIIFWPLIAFSKTYIGIKLMLFMFCPPQGVYQSMSIGRQWCFQKKNTQLFFFFFFFKIQTAPLLACREVVFTGGLSSCWSSRGMWVWSYIFYTSLCP